MPDRPDLPEVFISYAREDVGYKSELVRWLWEHGIAVWSDERIERGVRFPPQLIERIEQAAAFIPIMSPASERSEWVERELDVAIRKPVRIYPLLLKGEPFTTIVSDFQYDDVSGGRVPPPIWFSQLAEAVGRNVPGSRTPPSGRETAIGRADEVQELRRMLIDRVQGPVVVKGFPGMGKSMLVRLALRTMPHEHLIGWYDAAGYGLEASTESAVDLATRAANEGVESIVVIDNVTAPAGEVNRILDRLDWVIRSGTRLIVTMRASAGEVHCRRLVREVVLLDLPRGAAMRLLHRLGVTDDDACAELFELAGGNPWLLTMSAEARARGRSEEDIPEIVAADIEHRLEREASLLPEETRLCLEAVGMAHMPMSFDTADELLQRPGLIDAVSSRLLRLVAEGWIEQDAGSVTARPVIAMTISRMVVARLRRELPDDAGGLGPVRLFTATAPDHVQDLQRRHHLRPLVELLHWTGRPAREYLEEALAANEPGPFAVGNLINLAITGGESLERIDLTDQRISDVDLRAVDLRNASLRQAELVRVRLRLHLEGVISIACSPSGDQIAVGAADGRIHLVFGSDGSLQASLHAHDDVVNQLAFNSSGGLLASCSDDGACHVWDVGDRAIIRTFRVQRGLTATALSTSGDLVAGGGHDRVAWIWNRRSGRTEWHFDVDAQVTRVAFSTSDRMLAVGTRSGSVYLWDIVDDRELLRTTGLGASISTLAFDPADRYLWASSADGRGTQRWVIDSTIHKDPPPHALARTGVRLSDRTTFAMTVLGQSTIEVRESASGTFLAGTRPDDLRFQSVDLNEATGLLVAGGDSQAVRCWNATTGRELWTIRGHSNWVKSAHLLSDGKTIVCCADDRKLHLWNWTQDRHLASLPAGDGHIRGIATHPTSARRVFTAIDDRSVVEWDIPERRVLRRFEPHDAPAWAVCPSPDGRLLVTGSLSGRATLWVADSATHLATLQAHDGAIRSICFDPQARWFATAGDDGLVTLWSLDRATDREPRRLRSLHGHQDSVWAVDAARGWHRSLLVSAGMDRTVRLWGADSGRELAVLEGHNGPVWAAVFAGGCRNVLTGGSDGTVRKWLIPRRVGLGLRYRGELEASTTAHHDDWVRSIDAYQGGRLVVTGGHDGKVVVRDDSLRPLRELPVLRPYEGLDISGVTGLGAVEIRALVELGAWSR